MGRGRNPKPTAIKVLEGNPGKAALPSYEPGIPADFPDAPDSLSEGALKEWNHLAPILHGSHILRSVDGNVLAQYCEAFASWQNALRQIRDTGGAVIYETTKNGIISKRNPWALERDAQSDRMHKLGIELGLTPASRARIVVLPSKKKEEGEKFKYQFGNRDVAGKIG